MNYGYFEGFFRDPRDYIFGGLKMPSVPYQEDGNWETFLPKYEPQAENYETYGCTVWGTQNALETLYKRIYATEPNYSERFTYILAGVTTGGANPNQACESIRKDGVVDQDALPIPKTLAEFNTPKPMIGSLLAKGQYWLGKHQFLHEWVWDEKPSNWKDLLREALKTSPLGVSVSAWNLQNGVYVSTGDVNNHWCMLYHIDEEGYMYVFDSYDHSKKTLAKDHNIRRAKRYFINRLDASGAKKQINVLQTILNFLLMKKTLLEVCKANIGLDASPNDEAPDELGCANTVTALLRQVYPEVPIITGTYTLWQYLKDPKNGFVPSVNYSPETVIISPTGTGKGTGHTGIFLENGIVASNDSRTGRFTMNYNLSSWQKRYRDNQGMPVYLYRRA